jgi:dihydroflavonol-4-reductase
MARKKMFYSSAKAAAELGFQARPARLAVEDAVAWFRANGMLRR